MNTKPIKSKLVGPDNSAGIFQALHNYIGF
jgi:hypothetical protein